MTNSKIEFSIFHINHKKECFRLNKDELLQYLNKTPIKLNIGLIKEHLAETTWIIKRDSQNIISEMKSKTIQVKGDFIKESAIIEFIENHLDSPNNEYIVNGRISLAKLETAFPCNPFVSTYLNYRRGISLKQKLELLLEHENNGTIQPSFFFNSADSIYTKPALQIPYWSLAQYFDCDYYSFSSFKDLIRAVSNAKIDSEIITVIRKTVFYRNANYKKDKEKRRQKILKMIKEQYDFIPLESYYEEFTLEELGYKLISSDERDSNEAETVFKEYSLEELEAKFLNLFPTKIDKSEPIADYRLPVPPQKIFSTPTHYHIKIALKEQNHLIHLSKAGNKEAIIIRNIIWAAMKAVNLTQNDYLILKYYLRGIHCKEVMFTLILHDNVDFSEENKIEYLKLKDELRTLYNKDSINNNLQKIEDLKKKIKDYEDLVDKEAGILLDRMMKAFYQLMES